MNRKFMGIGVAFGAAFGAVFEHIAMGVTLGIVFGVGTDAIIDIAKARRDQRPNA